MTLFATRSDAEVLAELEAMPTAHDLLTEAMDSGVRVTVATHNRITGGHVFDVRGGQAFLRDEAKVPHVVRIDDITGISIAGPPRGIEA